MLVLARNIGQKIMIGNDIIIHVLSSQGPQIRIGIEAPRDIRVDRQEVYERIKKAKSAGSEKLS